MVKRIFHYMLIGCSISSVYAMNSMQNNVEERPSVVRFVFPEQGYEQLKTNVHILQEHRLIQDDQQIVEALNLADTETVTQQTFLEQISHRDGPNGHLMIVRVLSPTTNCPQYYVAHAFDEWIFRSDPRNIFLSNGLKNFSDVNTREAIDFSRVAYFLYDSNRNCFEFQGTLQELVNMRSARGQQLKNLLQNDLRFVSLSQNEQCKQLVYGVPEIVQGAPFERARHFIQRLRPYLGMSLALSSCAIIGALVKLKDFGWWQLLDITTLGASQMLMPLNDYFESGFTIRYVSFLGGVVGITRSSSNLSFHLVRSVVVNRVFGGIKIDHAITLYGILAFGLYVPTALRLLAGYIQAEH